MTMLSAFHDPFTLGVTHTSLGSETQCSDRGQRTTREPGLTPTLGTKSLFTTRAPTYSQPGQPPNWVSHLRCVWRSETRGRDGGTRDASRVNLASADMARSREARSMFCPVSSPGANCVRSGHANTDTSRLCCEPSFEGLLHTACVTRCVAVQVKRVVRPASHWTRSCTIQRHCAVQSTLTGLQRHERTIRLASGWILCVFWVQFSWAMWVAPTSVTCTHTTHTHTHTHTHTLVLLRRHAAGVPGSLRLRRCVSEPVHTGRGPRVYPATLLCSSAAHEWHVCSQLRFTHTTATARKIPSAGSVVP